MLDDLISSILTSRSDPSAPSHLVDRNVQSLARKGRDLKFPEHPPMDKDTRKRLKHLLGHAQAARARSGDTSLLLSSTPTPPPPSSSECTPSPVTSLLPEPSSITPTISIHRAHDFTPSASSSASSTPAPDRLSLPIDGTSTIRKRRSADAVVLGQSGSMVPSPEKKLRRVAKSTGSGWDMKHHPSFSK